MGGNAKEVARPFLDVLLPEFHFHRSPGAVSSLEDGISLEARALPVVEDRRTDRLGVDPQITHNKRLEEQTECLGVSQEALRARAKSSGRKRWVDEVSRFGGPQDAAGPEGRSPR